MPYDLKKQLRKYNQSSWRTVLAHDILRCKPSLGRAGQLQTSFLSPKYDPQPAVQHLIWGNLTAQTLQNDQIFAPI
jgi:hypothetical protein